MTNDEIKAKASGLITEARKLLMSIEKPDGQLIAQILRLGYEAALTDGDPFKAPDYPEKEKEPTK